MQVNEPIIVADNLSFIRNGEVLFNDFSFDVKPGSYVAVIGPNGGGKTTLMRVLLGLTKPTSGSVMIFGRPPTHPEARRRIGYVPQRGGLIDQMFPATAEEVVAAGRAQRDGLRNFFAKNDRHAIDDAFSVMRIEHLKYRPIGSLSGGERQRVLLARALAAEPDLLVLDEPVDGLDPASREEFYDALRRINTLGKTILFVTHDVHRIAREAVSAICLRHELVCHGVKACHISGRRLRNIHHGTRAELAEHHGA
jgi:zinc transport system ATP-binding protein